MRMTTVALIVAAVSAWQAQPTPNMDALVSRLGAYLLEYEQQLSTVIAQERYKQSETQFEPGAAADVAGNTRIRTRSLDSEVAFLRLPGNAEWFGVRHVLIVDGRKIEGNTPGLLATVTSGEIEQAARIRAIVLASSRHNLGSARTINMPTVPLELLHPKHRRRFVFTLGSTTTVARLRVQEIRYRELNEPSIILYPKGRSMLARGSVWVTPDGRVLRVTLHLAFPHQLVVNVRTGDNELRVDFAANDALAMLVPRELREDFELAGGGRFQGRATYSQFRRFTTAARIIPPPLTAP